MVRDRKSMSVLVADKNSTKRKHKNELFVKGAPESVLQRCTHFLQGDGTKVLLTKKMREEIGAEIQGMSKKALRCLAMAIKDDPRRHPWSGRSCTNGSRTSSAR